MAWSNSGWGVSAWGRGIYTSDIIENARANDVAFGNRTYPVVVVEGASAKEITASPNQTFAILALANASGIDKTTTSNTFNFTVVEAARAVALPSTRLEINISVVVDIAGVAGVSSAGNAFFFGITEKATLTESSVSATQQFGVLVIEPVFLIEKLVAHSIYPAPILETASVRPESPPSITGIYVPVIVEAASSRDVPDIGGSSVYSFTVSEYAAAEDLPNAIAVRSVLILETASAKDAAVSVGDLWIPVDDNEDSTWVPVNDNPFDTWTPVPVTP